MRPYFSVGEEVILCSTDQPESNGEYCIYAVLFSGDSFICRLTGVKLNYTDEFGYVLDPPIRQNNCKLGAEAAWCQKALQKKHKPADQSYSELIKSTREIKV